MDRILKKIIIATGGTGGHVIPAYNLAKHFNDRKINVEVISDKRGIKYIKEIQLPGPTIKSKTDLLLDFG